MSPTLKLLNPQPTETVPTEGYVYIEDYTGAVWPDAIHVDRIHGHPRYDPLSWITPSLLGAWSHQVEICPQLQQTP